MTLNAEESPETQTNQLPKPSLFARISGLSWAALALLTVFTYWQQPLVLNLASSFRIQLLAALALASLPPTVLFRGTRRTLFFGVTALISLTFAGYYLPPQTVSGKELPIAVANVYSGNRNLATLKSWLESQPAEILGLLEIAPHHREALAELSYPYALVEPRENNFGLALLSKVEPLKSSVIDRDSPFPSILAEFEDYYVLLTHPFPPLGREAREIGDRQIERLAKLVGGLPKPCVVIGDLNAAAWDRRAEPLKSVGLRDSREGFGIIPTWPTHRWWMQIPIDHIMIPESWGVKECERGWDIGSDHYPLRALLVVP